MRQQGVWALAWRRLRADGLGFGSLIVVLAYVALTIAAASGLVAHDWQKEAGVSFAPPSFLGPDAGESRHLLQASERRRSGEDYGIADPLAGDLAAIAKELSGGSVSEARAPTLPLGGDKWGRDVLKKAVKGTETSLFVGLAAAALATFLGTLFGAQAGYRGGA